MTNWLAQSVQIYSDDAIASDAAIPLLLEAARNYLLAGGIVTPEYWKDLHTNEQAALATAGAELRGEVAEDEAETLLDDGLATTVEMLERRCG